MTLAAIFHRMYMIHLGLDTSKSRTKGTSKLHKHVTKTPTPPTTVAAALYITSLYGHTYRVQEEKSKLGLWMGWLGKGVTAKIRLLIHHSGAILKFSNEEKYCQPAQLEAVQLVIHFVWEEG